MRKVLSYLALLLVLLLSNSRPANSAPQQPALAEDSVPGPDMLVGDITSLVQLGTDGGEVGLAMGGTFCNDGDTALGFFALPNPDHPVVAQNLYRMSGGATNDERFEQVGQSWVAHLFFALEQNICGFGCTAVGNGTRLGAGCSDSETASIDGYQNNLGSRAWVNGFTGVFPGSNPGPSDHTNHTHTGTSHRLLVDAGDLNTTLNPGASYYAEAQSVTPHEFVWCQAHAGQCNMANDISFRRFNVTGTSTFGFSAIGSTMRFAPAITAWTGATISTLEPAPGTDGRAFVACKVTNPSAGVWHYEYALYNQSLDRAIQSVHVPLGCGVTVSNVGFHAPPQHPGFANDGTQNDAGFSSAPWSSSQTATSLTWNCETLVQNPNANAIRWGTLYNFRFDSNRPPQTTSATIGFFKTGAPAMVEVQAPMPDACALQIVSAVSRKTHGSAGQFDINIPLSGPPGVECRGSGGNHTLLVMFNNDVISGNATIDTGTGNISGSPSFSGNTMTINLSGTSDAQTLTIRLSNITDQFSQVMPDALLTVKFSSATPMETAR